MPDDAFFAFRAAWRAHRELGQASGQLYTASASVAVRMGRRTSFGELASILEEELSVSDEAFLISRFFWRAKYGLPPVNIVHSSIVSSSLCSPL